MKKFVAMLLVLSMVLALAVAAMAESKIEKDMWVKFKKDSPAYTDHKSSTKTKNVVQKKSVAWCDRVCSGYARLIVNDHAKTKRWFKTCDLQPTDKDETKVIWAKGGKGMSTCRKGTISEKADPELKDYYLKVSGHTNLRKNCGMKFKTQGAVEKGDLLKMTGYIGYDDRDVPWLQICKGKKKLWVSWNFVVKDGDYLVRFNKCGKKKGKYYFGGE